VGRIGGIEQPRPSSADQAWDTDQVTADAVEQEVGADAGEPAMFDLAHGAVLLAPAENAFDHLGAGLGDGIAGMARGAGVDAGPRLNRAGPGCGSVRSRQRAPAAGSAAATCRPKTGQGRVTHPALGGGLRTRTLISNEWKVEASVARCLRTPPAGA
jgi:hypothetical protein